MMERQKSIGIFDSGVGGLSIGKAIQAMLPEENLVYFADLECSPYGNKPKDIIMKRSEDIITFLRDQSCKLVVVACNTATVNSIADLRAKLSIPIVGVEPAIKPAALLSESGVIGVLATAQTLQSESFKMLKSRYASNVNIETQACPEFVSIVEQLEHNDESATQIAEQYIRPLLQQGSDQIVLGCTHFSFLRAAIESVVGNKANIIDTAIPVAIEVKRRLDMLKLHNSKSNPGGIKFWASADSAKAAKTISELWQQDIEVSHAKIY